MKLSKTLKAIIFQFYGTLEFFLMTMRYLPRKILVSNRVVGEGDRGKKLY